MKCQQCKWDIQPTRGYDGAYEMIESLDGAVFDTFDCLIAYESELGAKINSDAISYLIGEYHGAASRGDGQRVLATQLAMNILDARR